MISTKQASEAVSNSKERLDGVVIAFMLLIHGLAIWSLFYFSMTNLVILAALWFVTGCFGITLGFHRLLTHRSFKVPKWLERFFATCGILALQGSPLKWVSHHRMHHAGSDTPKDPHNATRGFWFSHLYWMLIKREEIDDNHQLRRFARDISADPYYRFFESIPALILMQAVLGGVLYMIGGFPAVGWGIFVRLVVGYHVTWFVNSASHIWGYQTYDSGDSSKNNWWIGILAFGEGWHNNHHAFGNTARAGHKWWELDVTYGIIVLLKWLGLATDIKGLPDDAEKYLIKKPTAKASKFVNVADVDKSVIVPAPVVMHKGVGEIS